MPGYSRYCPYTAGADAGAKWHRPDVDRARRLVNASGTRGATVTVWVPENHRGEEPVVVRLLRSLGYRPRLVHVASTAYLTLRTNARIPQAGLLSWFADFPAPSNFFETFFACNSPGNLSRFCDHRVDAQIRRASRLETTDPYLANRLWERVDREVVDDAPFVPLVSLQSVDIVSRRVGNYQLQPPVGVVLDQLWVR